MSTEDQSAFHLDDEQWARLRERYYQDSEPVARLMAEFGIPGPATRLIGLMPPEVLDVTCPWCEQALRRRYPSRGMVGRRQWAYCEHCGHRETDPRRGDRCGCNGCRESESLRLQTLESEKRRRIDELYDLDLFKPIAYEQLQLPEKLVLAAAIRVYGAEPFERLEAMAGARTDERLMPTREMALHWLDRLWQADILLVDPGSELRAFEGSRCETVDLERARFRLNLTFDGATRASLAQLYRQLNLDLASGCPPDELASTQALAMQLGREEVLQYLLHCAYELNVDFQCLGKAREVIEPLLETLAVRELYYLGQLAVEKAHLYHSRGMSRGRRHAGNTIPGKLQSLAERARANQWRFYERGRPPHVPRTVLSELIYDQLVGDMDIGFRKSPGHIWAELHAQAAPAEEPASAFTCASCEDAQMQAVMIEEGIELRCTRCGEVRRYSPVTATP